MSIMSIIDEIDRDNTLEEEIEQDLIEKGYKGDELAEAVQEVLDMLDNEAMLEDIAGPVEDALQRGCFFVPFGSDMVH